MVDNKDSIAYDNIENLLQNSVAQAANHGAFSFAITPISDITQINPGVIEINDNLDETIESLKETNQINED